MSRCFCLCIILLAASGLVMADGGTPESTSEDMNCQKLNNLTEVMTLNATDFYKVLVDCVNKTEEERNVTATAEVLIMIADYLLAENRLDKLSDPAFTNATKEPFTKCINNNMGYSIKSSNLTNHFGLTDMVSFRFKNQECTLADSLKKCINSTMAGLKQFSTQAKIIDDLMTMVETTFCTYYRLDRSAGNIEIPTTSAIITNILVLSALAYTLQDIN